MLTKIFKDKTARETARANIGISKPLRIKDGDRSCDQHILQQTVDIVRKTAEKPKLPHIKLASSQTLAFTAAAAVRTTLSVNKTLKVRNGSIGSPRGKLVSAIIAIVLAAVFATAMSAHPNQPQFAGVYGWVAGGSAAPRYWSSTRARPVGRECRHPPQRAGTWHNVGQLRVQRRTFASAAPSTATVAAPHNPQRTVGSVGNPHTCKCRPSKEGTSAKPKGPFTAEAWMLLSKASRISPTSKRSSQLSYTP